jgi:hypothetical protein
VHTVAVLTAWLFVRLLLLLPCRDARRNWTAGVWHTRTAALCVGCGVPQHQRRHYPPHTAQSIPPCMCKMLVVVTGRHRACTNTHTREHPVVCQLSCCFSCCCCYCCCWQRTTSTTWFTEATPQSPVATPHVASISTSESKAPLSTLNAAAWPSPCPLMSPTAPHMTPARLHATCGPLHCCHPSSPCYTLAMHQ